MYKTHNFDKIPARYARFNLLWRSTTMSLTARLAVFPDGVVGMDSIK